MRRQFGFPLRKLGAAVAVTALLMVPLAMFGGPALAYTASALHQYGRSSASQYQYRVTVCHRAGWKHHRSWREISVSNRAVKAHLRHGDRLAPCTKPDNKRRGKAHGEDDRGKGDRGKGGHGKNSRGNGNHGNGNHGNGQPRQSVDGSSARDGSRRRPRYGGVFVVEGPCTTRAAEGSA